MTQSNNFQDCCPNNEYRLYHNAFRYFTNWLQVYTGSGSKGKSCGGLFSSREARRDGLERANQGNSRRHGNGQ